MFFFSKLQGRRHAFQGGVRLSPGVAAGPSPDHEDLEYLRRRGFRSVINLNPEGAPGERMSPNVEASWAHAEDLVHARASLYAFPTSADVDTFLARLAPLPEPVYVHSIDGKSALTLAWIAAALAGEELQGRFDALIGERIDERWRAFARAEIRLRTS